MKKSPVNWGNPQFISPVRDFPIPILRPKSEMGHPLLPSLPLPTFDVRIGLGTFENGNGNAMVELGKFPGNLGFLYVNWGFP